MRIGIPKEQSQKENRVAATPKTVTEILKLGFEVLVEQGAGNKANFQDHSFVEAGGTIASKQDVWGSDIILKVNPPTEEEISWIKEGATLIGFIWPAQNEALLKKLSSKRIHVLAMDCVPRISRAQSLDALSSMANIAGYRAVIESAHEFGRLFTGQVTAAGKVPPAKVLVIGAGVAGLAAIGAAKSLGAIVRAFDTRPETKEQVESMGATFLSIDFKEKTASEDGYAKVMSEAFNRRALALYTEQAKDVDIIITTALIPGRPAPRLITKEMVDSMKAGSVVVDLAAATGGNCEYTQADQCITTGNQVKVIGYTDLPSRLPTQSSQLYATNLLNLLKLLSKTKDGNIHIDFEDVVHRSITVIRDGEITWPAPPIKVSAKPQTAPKIASKPVKKEVKSSHSLLKYSALLLVASLLFVVISSAPPEFLSHFSVFALSCVVGYYVVWNVSHSLHTPLMSVTNAISGIIIVGALLQIAQGGFLLSVLAFIAILVASINIFGGFKVTQRMLAMFKKDEKEF
ncbi:MAG: Re/Si-specific NAD(P)(+) transhydrogenase subunit alpha [Alcaligenaceae bacterium]|nr:Re/Si-specific NAD(P)(+) transhydrogenase subunit alpha [Alcaligenaceae bacterium]